MNDVPRVDVHAHAFPADYLREIAQVYPDDVRLSTSDDGGLVAVWAGVPLPAWDPEPRLAEMSRDGVSQEVLSAPVVYSWLDGRTAGFCRLLNDFQAEVARRHPGRYRWFLHLPVHDRAELWRELERWQDDEEVAGVVLGSNMGGRYPGDASLLPMWEAIAERSLPAFIHPIQPATLFGPAAPPIVLFPCDTTMAAASLIYGGILERFPDLRVILSHYGGALPMLVGRLDMGVEVLGSAAGHGQDLPQQPSAYVSRFYADTAQGFHEPAFRCASAVFGMDHILYGSDRFLAESPWRPRLNRFLHGLHLSEPDAAAVFAGNANRILPVVGGARRS